ncbi:MAG: hypothetical protein HZB55_13800 [Deltaproteobacteria bacterium]|nr:hypothetical protein [Deltaproteobacteria bacterium]
MNARRGPMGSLCLWGAAWLALSAAPGRALGDAGYDEGKRSWLAGRYQEAYDRLLEFRKTPFGRRAEVDYMLGTSGCRLAGKRRWGGDVLDWMLYAYALSRDGRRLVVQERDLCRTELPALEAAAGNVGAVEDVSSMGSAGMWFRGKTFYWVDRDVPVDSHPVRRIGPLDPQEIEARRVALTDEAGARRVAERLAPGFRTSASARLVLATRGGQSVEDLRTIAAQLEQYLDFLGRRYGVAAPRQYVFVYLVPSVEDLRALAQRIHRLDVSPSTIGYSFREDMSVVGVIPGTAAGTLYHELFHLAVRDNFGDIPLWLDEALASLYEVSSVRGGEVRGEPNWRGKVLEELWGSRPTLSELIRNQWLADEEQAPGDDPTYQSPSSRRQAASMATARYFALYLQENGKLADVYRAFQGIDLQQIDRPPASYAVRLVEQAVGQPIDALQASFEAWFRAVERRGLPAERSTTGEPALPSNRFVPNSANAPPTDSVLPTSEPSLQRQTR